jgi:hypothetical protein
VAQALRRSESGLSADFPSNAWFTSNGMEMDTMKQVLPIAAGVVSTVPEPGTLTLLGAGAAIVAVGAWWRNRK